MYILQTEVMKDNYKRNIILTNHGNSTILHYNNDISCSQEFDMMSAKYSGLPSQHTHDAFVIQLLSNISIYGCKGVVQ